ncbi:PTR2-domain-containing protein [Aaosphaeria arxii CBS 175.79]|uniref:PTR2-domain-containing protein n=1 Tax=Aaosphaeria arxii CBS 175.79 TaxID=1450172 RepID=A0A6A5X6B1_9PLEO|nr:PTR2-domain-containing protein [Aaosphaeria arxii CBS 175.79]KAF2008440.1 PTR2-domain-containing protein [Aaosphaeria arxii CBS 175.79]
MSSRWNGSRGEERGAYASIAQTENETIFSSNHQEELGKDYLSDDDVGKEVSSDRETQYLTGDSDEAGREDLEHLPHVADKLPYGAFLVAIVELCERFAYYGLSGPFQNYMANKYDDPNGLPGALGLSQSGATALSNFFQFFCYVTPILGAIVADQFLGKFLTIKYFSIVYMTGIVILFLTSLPICIEKGIAFPGLIASMIIIGVGTGGIKSNVSPLVAEQVRTTRPFVKTLSNGNRVIVDPEVTIQRIYMVFYMCINIGSISAIATTTLELHVGFWSAYLLPLIMFCVGYFILIAGKDRYVIRPPQGGVIGNCFRAIWIGVKNGFDLEKSKPSRQPRPNIPYPWTDGFVDELRTALLACKVFLFYPVYWVTFSQMATNFVSQAGQMQLHGLPNDILPNIDPITVIILIPVFDRLIYPFIRTRLRIDFHPLTRITYGFVFASLAMAYAAMLQARIYSAPPCYTSPSKCEAGRLPNSRIAPNEVHVAWQAPAYIVLAISEILASVTGLEFAYKNAPESMKSFIMSLFLLTSAFGSALGMLLSPFAKDPNLVWLYTGLSCTALAGGGLFHWTFKSVAKPQGALPAVETVEEYELESRKSGVEAGSSGGD